MSRHRLFRYREVVLHHVVDEFDDAGAVVSHHGTIRRFFQHGHGIGDGDGIFGMRQHGMIVFSVADRHDVVGRKFQLFEGRRQAGGFVDAMGKDHDRAFVKDDAQFEAEIPDDIENDGFIGYAGGDNGMADAEMLHPSTLHFVQKRRQRELGQAG